MAFAAVLLVALTLTGCPFRPPKPRVLIYGDSLTVETGQYLAAGFDPNKVDLVFHYSQGTALCQWLPSMQDEAKSQTAAVIIEFAGNSVDANVCMDDPSTGHAYAVSSPGWLAKYTADAQSGQAIWTAAGVPTYWAQLPPLGLPYDPDPVPNVATYSLNVAYAQTGGHFVDAGSTVAEADGSFAWWKDCLPGEPCDIGGSQGTPPTGTDQVRSGDRVHFCPTGYPCTGLYSPGAARFGGEQAAAVATAFGFGPDPTTTTTSTSTTTGSTTTTTGSTTTTTGSTTTTTGSTTTTTGSTTTTIPGSTTSTTTSGSTTSTTPIQVPPGAVTSRPIPGPSKPPIGVAAGPL